MPGTPRCKAVRPISQQRMSGIVLLRTFVRKDRSCSSLLAVLTNAQDLRCKLKIPMFRLLMHGNPRKHLDPSNGKDKQNAMCIQGALPGSAALTAGDRASRRSNCRTTPKHTLCLSTAAATGVHLCVRVTTVCKSQIRSVLLAEKRRHTKLLLLRQMCHVYNRVPRIHPAHNGGVKIRVQMKTM